MTLHTLSLENVRNLQPVRLRLDAGSNVIVGANGSGKTSLLESIYLAGRGHSFRTRRTEQLISQGAQRLGVRAELTGAGTSGLTIAVDYDRTTGLQARVDGDRPTTIAELSARLPVQVIDPGVHRWIEEGPALRRRWLDWVVFHVEPWFLHEWRRYRRALEHRGAALQRSLDPMLWEHVMAESGERLSAARARVIEALQARWKACVERLGIADVELSYRRGWGATASLAEQLVAQRVADSERGRALVGPHRFDVLLRQQGRAAREVVSRGQQKLLAAAMILVATEYLASLEEAAPLLLVDDLAAELDPAHAQALFMEVKRVAGQLVMTAQRLEPPGELVARRVFHVEHGRVEPL